MTRFRDVAPLVAAGAAALVIAGCGGATGTAASSSAATSTAAAPTDAAGLSSLLRASTSRIHSFHLSLSVAAAATTLTGSGDATVAGGKVRSLNLTEQIPPVGSMRLVIADGKTYLNLPTSLSHAAKPWVLVTPDSTNIVVRQLATALDTVQQSASLDQFTTFSKAATVRAHKQEDLDGSPTTHYTLDVDVQKLPDTLPGKHQLITAGLASLPIEMWLDAQGRPVKLTEQVTVKGQQVSTDLTIGKYDQPVTVTPPPADQVAVD
jgi:hypothetical protein